MIKLESIHIEEFRGIRSLDLDLNRKTFAISGPNGSGKSGVIDAIEFVLTGEIKRLMGSGTGGLSVSQHGPHVDKADSPELAIVELTVFIPELDKSVKITRCAASPRKRSLEPDEADVRTVLAEIADHPAMTLSRRDVIRFILSKPASRSQEIQALLNLDELGQTRSAFNRAANQLRGKWDSAASQARSRRNNLQRHLEIDDLTKDKLLEAVREPRETLELTAITKIEADTKLDSGIAKTADEPVFNKKSALADLKALTDAMEKIADLGKTEAAAIVGDIESLERDPALLRAFKQCTLVEKGLELVGGPACPLCDTVWEDETQLRNHLEVKLVKSETARKLKSTLSGNGRTLSGEVTEFAGLLDPIEKLANSEEQTVFASQISDWIASLGELKSKLANVEGIIELKEQFIGGWIAVPESFRDNLTSITITVNEKPDQSAKVAAQSFLVLAQAKLFDFRESRRESHIVGTSAAAAEEANEQYCRVLNEELEKLYDQVQDDFSAFYRELNGDDEGEFDATFTPREGSLDLAVDFQKRGHFPPGAYHSEGHQDSMGVCLYLALMMRLFGKGFTFALLDDVVMSVDAGHRLQFCKLLKTRFPDTQFVITTHDRHWAEQMKSEGLISSKTSIAFYGWTIDSGPLFESPDVWTDIDKALEKEHISEAAAALRRHLEYESRNLADELGAHPQFRADGNYDLGGLLPPVTSRLKDLLGKAANAAQSWGRDTAHESVVERKKKLLAAAEDLKLEQWAVNRAVHYTEWATFTKAEFKPVVKAARELLQQFHCDKCGSWLYVLPKFGCQDELRCTCSAININLKPKPR